MAARRAIGYDGRMPAPADRPQKLAQSWARTLDRARRWGRRELGALAEPQVVIIRRAPLWRMARRVLMAACLAATFWGLYQWGYRDALQGYPVSLRASAAMILERRQLLDELAQARQQHADLQVQDSTRDAAMEQLRLDLQRLGLEHQSSLNSLALYSSIMDPRADDPAVAVEHASIERLGPEYSLRFILVRRDGKGLQPRPIDVEVHLDPPDLQLPAENPAKISLRRLQSVVLPLRVPDGFVPSQAELRVDFGERYEPIALSLAWPQSENDYVEE